MAPLIPIFVGVLCGLFAAFKSGNPFVFVLGFLFGIVLTVALSVFIVSLVLPAARSILRGFKKGPH